MARLRRRGEPEEGPDCPGVEANANGSFDVNSAEMAEAFSKMGLEPQASTPEQFAAFIRSEIAQNIKLIQSAGIKAE